jgi:hypothetical protein
MFKLIARIFLLKQVIDFFRSRRRPKAGRRY